MTPELLEAAARGPTSAPPDASAAFLAGLPADVPISGFVGIRPGSRMIDPYGCTMNFVFEKNGAKAIGTAGHCVDKVGQPVSLITIAPGTSKVVVVEIGSVLALHDNGVGDDFALVSVKQELQSWVYPTIAVVGGPCGAYGDDGGDTDIDNWNPVVKGENPIEVGETIFHYGHGLGIGTGGTARSGAATAWTTNAYAWAGTAVFGDSGSAARVGRLAAAGDLTHLLLWAALKLPGTTAGTRISKMLSIAKGYTLVESDHCPPDVPDGTVS